MVFIICAWHAERGGTEARTLIFDRVQSLRQLAIAKLERKHHAGYERYPVKAGEFERWEAEQAWGEA